ncbi:Protein SERAC1 [Fusarium oxysporum f. sp. cubense race 1]|uniref:Protein SERAC1 n=1 Tax=Fusarium oxysporum f. sp. cubense (strain race 1) TaxID=1229664 RepID=N4U793_FUSC1|nr:Protein SERAC1 [Fusarium oxysporum f. sp. cubense race 1]
MGSENRSIARYETTAVYTHPEAKVDIVLVHGLNGTPDKTWTAKNGTFWPLDLLPVALRGAQANVLVYGYNADVYSKKNNQTASDSFIHQHAQNLITNLTLHRQSEGTFKNPIIWVCHSLGGILVKRALLYSSDVREPHLEHFRSIFVSTFGLVFLGTPHVGSDAATWGLILQAMSDAVIPKRFFDSESVLLRTLKKDNETLANINSHFLDIYQRFEIHMVRENQKTDIKGHKIFIVDANSAGPQLPGVTYYGIEASHSNMCKFDGTSSPGFRNIAITIQQWIQRAPSATQERWLAEEDERRACAMIRANEIMSPYTSLKALDKRTPVRTHDLIGKRSLNKTFTVLIAFALIERDEIEDVPSVSTPGETIPSSRPMEPLDVLKIHGIVQSFFLEALKKDGQYNFWLERAAAVFLESFDRGDSRAKNNKEMGIPDDYRRYATQCRRILKHLQEVDRPSLELMAVEQALQGRFEDMQVKIRTLARSMTTDSEGRWVRGPYVSVFEKSNSASLSSSFTTPDDDNIEEEKQAPWDLRTSFPSLEADNDVPYPYDSTMPVPVFYEDDDTLMGSVVSQQRPAERRSSGNSPRVSERDLNESWTLIREPSVSRSRPLFEPAERVVRPTVRGQSVGAIPRPDSHPREITRERVEENPFMGSGDGIIPTMEIANADWLTHDRITDRPRASHSDTSLDADIDQWAPGLPITSHSVSSLRPVSHRQQPASYHRRTLSTGEVLSSSLPNSLASSTLRPPSSGPESHSSQPMSRNSSSRSDQPVSSNPPVPMWARRVPAATATEPSPRRSTNSPDNISLGYQSWQLRQSGPWNSEGASRREITPSPRPEVEADGADMVRSGSGGIQFHGRIIEFGRLQPATAQPVYPLEISESTHALESQTTATRRRRNTNSQPPGYPRPDTSR